MWKAMKQSYFISSINRSTEREVYRNTLSNSWLPKQRLIESPNCSTLRTIQRRVYCIWSGVYMKNRRSEERKGDFLPEH